MDGELFLLKPGQRLEGIPHKAWNAFVEAARYAKGQQRSLGRSAVRDVPQTGIVRVKNCSGEDRDRFDVLGIDEVFPQPADNPSRFKVGPVLHGVTPDKEKHCGRFVVLLEPAKSNKIVSACITGITVARLHVGEDEDWLQSADIEDGKAEHLKARVQGSAKILWREEGTGTVWAVVRLSNHQPNHYLAKIPSGGIPARRGLQTGTAQCDLFSIDETGLLEPVRRPGGDPVRVDVRHHGTQPIRGPVNVNEPQYLGVTFDGQESWLLDPPKQTLLCVPTRRIKPKSWGSARELRFVEGRWAPIGAVVSVYNVCDYALLASQQIVGHFHEDTSAYLSLGCRCCDGSSSSSSSSSSNSDSSTSGSSHSASSSSTSGLSSSVSSSISSESGSSSASVTVSSSSSSPSSSSTSGSSSQSSSGSGSSSRSRSGSASGSPSGSSGSVSVSVGGLSSSSSLSSQSDSSGSSGDSSQSDGGGSSSSESQSASPSGPSSDGPSGSVIVPPSESGSESEPPIPSDSGSPSTSESDSRPSTSDSNPPSLPPPGSSSSGCTSSWIWSCGWELLESNCDDPEPPEGTGDYDGALMETAA